MVILGLGNHKGINIINAGLEPRELANTLTPDACDIHLLQQQQ